MVKIMYELKDHVKDESAIEFGWDYEFYGGEDEEDFSLAISYAVTIDYLIEKGIVDDYVEEALNYAQENSDVEFKEPQEGDETPQPKPSAKILKLVHSKNIEKDKE